MKRHWAGLFWVYVPISLKDAQSIANYWQSRILAKLREREHHESA